MVYIKKQWDECYSFFRRELMSPLLFVTILFILVSILSWVVLYTNPPLLTSALSFLQMSMEGVSGDGVIGAGELFINNIRACAIAIGMGFVPLVFLGGVSLALNASTIGIVGAMYQYSNLSMAVLVAGLLPHGIFEFPAIFISLAISVKTSLLLSKRIFGRLETLDVKQHFFHILRVFVFIILPLLIVAAVVETHITPICMDWFL